MAKFTELQSDMSALEEKVISGFDSLEKSIEAIVSQIATNETNESSRADSIHDTISSHASELSEEIGLAKSDLMEKLYQYVQQDILPKVR